MDEQIAFQRAYLAPTQTIQTVSMAAPQASSRKAPAKPDPLFVDAPRLSEAQTRVMALINELPGSTIRQLTKPLGVSHATVTYHLAALVRKGLLVREREGREVRHYLPSNGKPDQYLAALCRNPTKRAIVQYLANQETNLSVNKMAKQLGIPFGFLKRTLVGLDKQGLIRLEARTFRYFVVVMPALRNHRWGA